MILQPEFELTRINRNVIRRILDALSNEGMTNMTNLATRANVQYTRLVKYVEWLTHIGAVRQVSDGKFRYVLITEKGKEVLANF